MASIKYQLKKLKTIVKAIQKRTKLIKDALSNEILPAAIILSFFVGCALSFERSIMSLNMYVDEANTLKEKKPRTNVKKDSIEYVLVKTIGENNKRFFTQWLTLIKSSNS